MAQYFSKNQNAIGSHHSQNGNISLSNQKENQHLLNTSSPSTNFTTYSPVELQINANNKLEKIDSHSSEKSVTITRCSSKPSRHESVQRATSQTRQRQRDRYINYRHYLEESQLYSLIVSSKGIECYGTNCQPSIFNASHRCRPILSENDIEESPLMNDQNIKENISYISLTNLTNIIDHEPNVSPRDSYSRSTSNILMHKPSLFLADIFNKMTHEQRVKSISQLTKLHENLTKSNTTTIDKLQQTTSLPNLNNKSRKLHSVTSLFDEDLISKSINPETSTNKHTTDLNEEATSAFIDQNVHTSVHISEPLDKQTISSPIKLTSLSSLDPLPEQKLSKENIQTILDEQPSKSKLKSFKTSKIEQINTESNLSNPTMNLLPVKKQQSETMSKEKTNQFRQETILKNYNDLSSTSSLKQNLQELYSEKDTNQPMITIKEKQMLLSSPHFQSSNDENEIENSLNDVTDHLSQQNIITSNKSLDMSFDMPSKESDETKQTLPLLNKIDQVSQKSKSSHSHLKKPTLLNTSPVITIDKETLSMIPTKPELTLVSTIDDGNTSIITRTKTASTNLTITDDDDEQSKLINEQLKRSSLGLARDSLELLRNSTPHHGNSDEQLIPHINIDSTSHKRKSALKSRFDSSDNLPTPKLISYIAIDDVKGDKRLMEEQMRRHSLTVGGGCTTISCTSPKPKRDSLILLQERYSESTTPYSGCYHLSSSDDKHVEFVREPGDTITPALHIGRGTKSKHPLGKSMSPPLSNDHFSSHTFDSSERSKSEMSIMGSQQRITIGTRPRRPSLDSISHHRTRQTPLISTTTSFIDANDIEEEKVCLNKSDYDELVRLIMTPLSKTKKKYPIKSTFESNIESNRLTTYQNLILLILLIFFYIFIFIKSQYWQEHNQQ